MFRKMNLSKRLFIGLSIIAAIVPITAVLGITNIRALSDADTRLYQSRTLPLDRLGEIAAKFEAMRRTSRDLAFAPSMEQAEKHAATLSELNTGIAKSTDLCENCHKDDAGALKMFQSFHESAADYYLQASKIIELRRGGKSREAMALLNTQEQKSAGAVQEWITTFRGLKLDAAQTTKSENSILVSRATRLTIVAILVALALVVGIGLALTTSITRPIALVEAALGKVAEGDFSERVEVDSQDELGRMAQALNQAMEKINSAMGCIGRHSEFLSSSSTELSAVSRQMTSSAEQTASQSTVVSGAATEVTANLQSVATATEEMTSSIREIASNVTDASRFATSAVKTAENASKTVAKLGDASNEVGQIIKVITSIAQQTNLLALNATIEAARAGEAGKGFAVVANEVKELAKETGQATEDITRKIETIQSDTRGAVNAIAEISAVISQINAISGIIAAAVEEQTATTNEIARNVTEAAVGGKRVAENITAVAAEAIETSGGASQTQRAALELTRVAGELQHLVSQFKCRNDGSPSETACAEEPPMRMPAVRASRKLAA
jgi:methyl-accepting chemotaxis protein